VITVEAFLQQYLKENSNLSNNYPGLKVERLVEEFIFFANDNYNDSKDFLINKVLLNDFLGLLEKYIPLEYINERSFFYKNYFYVNKSVLIPRFETELLVERSLELLSRKNSTELRILDVGTGSGIIGLSIANELKSAEVILSDICEDALEVARINTKQLAYMRSENVDIRTVQGDRLKNIRGAFDLIISNPPYILKSELSTSVHKQTSLYEPHKALFLEDGEYNSWFEEFFSSAYNSLKKKGIFYMEGHESHLQQLIVKAKKLNWYDIGVEQDLTGRFRFLKAIKE